ncbi:MAG: heparin lyase I family protein, partial [Actinobacteria bacterium]|nr:heparin lyase I family protein [Actinomycetota bacterium]
GDSGTLDTGMLTPGRHTVALRADAGDGRTAAWQADIVVEGESADEPATTTGATTSTPTTTTEPAPQQSGNVLWRGDYESGSFGDWVPQSACSPYYNSSQVGEGCASVIPAPVRQGAHAGRFEVRASGAATDTERAEVYNNQAATGGYDGQEWYYAWSTMFPAAGNPAGFSPTHADFNVFSDWHNADGPCGGNIIFGIDAKSTPEPRIYFMLAGRDPSNCGNVTSRQKYYLPLRYDHWYDFIVRIKWSGDPGRGFVEVWADGQVWVPRLAGATMFNANGAYWKQGFYRGAWDGGTNTVLHDAARRGDSLAAVQ